MKETVFLWVLRVIFILATTVTTGQAQTGSPTTMPRVGEVRRQVEVFDFPVWRFLRQGQRDSASVMTWNDYLGLDTVFVWNAVENGMARFTPFFGRDSIVVVTLDDGRDVVYRVKCKNRNLRVEEPVPQLPPPPPPAPEPARKERDTIIVLCPSAPPCPPAPPIVIQQAPCETCCPQDSVTHTLQILAGYENRRVGYQLDPGYGIGLEVDRFYYYRQDKAYPWVLRGWSPYGGLFASIGRRGEIFEVTCDTCGFWGPIESGLSFRLRVYAGLQLRLYQPKKAENLNSGVFGFVEASYDVYNSDHTEERGKFLGDENAAVWIGLKGQVPVPPDFPVVRAVDVRAGMLGSTYAKPDKGLGFSVGGFAGLYVVVGSKSAEVRLEQQIQRDSIQQERLEEQLHQNRTAQDSFLLLVNSDTIAIDTIALGQDSTDTRKIATAKAELLKLQLEYNELLKSARDGYVVWGALKRNIAEREEVEQTLSKLTEKKANREARRAEREAKKQARVKA